jgi:hypothetical protein
VVAASIRSRSVGPRHLAGLVCTAGGVIPNGSAGPITPPRFEPPGEAQQLEVWIQLTTLTVRDLTDRARLFAGASQDL